MPQKFLNKLKSCRLSLLILLLIALAGLYVRVECIVDWQRSPQICFYEGKPLLGALDGYYYLRLARDLLEGTYTKNDPLSVRGRPSPPPLLSSSTASIVRWTGFSLEWVACLLPVFLGLTVIFPLYCLGRFYGGRICGWVAALFGVLSPYYVYRSSFGWFDTDCLNLTFSLLLSYFALRFAVEHSPWRYLYLALVLATTLLFLLWWNTVPDVVILIAAASLFFALLFYYRPRRLWEWLMIAGVVLALAAFGYWQYAWLQAQYYRAEDLLLSLVRFARKMPYSSDLPPSALSTSEQRVPDFFRWAEATSTSYFTLLAGLAGFVFLSQKNWRHWGFLAVPTGLALFGIFIAERFLLFVAPVIGLGLGFLVAWLWWHPSVISGLRPRILWRSLVLLLAVGLLAPVGYFLYRNVMAWPRVEAYRVAGMVEVGKKTPPNALIWAWWDNGYPLQYWARRRAIWDGSHHGGISVYNAIPFAADNPRFAANFIRLAGDGGLGFSCLPNLLKKSFPTTLQFMRFALTNDVPTVRKIFQANGYKPEWVSSYLFPANMTPLYLYLDALNLKTAFWWYWYGTWNGKTGVHPTYSPFFNIAFKGNALVNGSSLRIDLETGLLDNQMQTIGLDHVYLRGDRGAGGYDYSWPSTLCFEAAVLNAFGVLASVDIANSLFNRLFVRTDSSVAPYFLPIILHAPEYQLWQVVPDKP